MWNMLECWTQDEELYYFCSYISISSISLIISHPLLPSNCVLSCQCLQYWPENVCLPVDPTPLSGGQVPLLPASAAGWVPAGYSDQPRLDKSGCTVATGRCPPGEKGILWQGSDCYGLPPGSGPSSTGPERGRCLEPGNSANCWKKTKME